MSLEICVVALGLVVLLADLWLPVERKRSLGYLAAGGLGLLFLMSVSGWGNCSVTGTAFGGMYVQDGLAIFFKRFFLLAGAIVLILATEFSDRIESGISEFYSLILFALTGMLFAASANDFALLFVSIELITVTFYVLNSFQRRKLISLEAGVKYLILGALSSAFLVYGIALVSGLAGSLNFGEIAAKAPGLAHNKLFLSGVLFVLVGLGFKIAVVPFQIWVPDVYQGSPTPATAFLAVGSKAAGFVLLLRVLFAAVPEITAQWAHLLMIVAAATILYGNLCAIPQRGLKRLLGYSSIANAGYLLLGVAALSNHGRSAMLYYLSGYLFTVLGAFAVLTIVLRNLESDDISALGGLNQRSPLLAATLALAMVSLAGIPPLAGFMGKFLLLRSVVEQGGLDSGYYWLVAVTVVGVVISLYYYFGVIRAIYWSRDVPDASPIALSAPLRVCLFACIAGMLFLGLFPGAPLRWVDTAIKVAGF
jgi:NADH-quinone oxidoreductase subunit N